MLWKNLINSQTGCDELRSNTSNYSRKAIMDTLTSTLLSALLLLLVSTVVIYVQQKLFSKPGSSKLPPGPKPLPVLGNLLELGDQPHQSLAKLSQTHGPLMTLKLGAVTTIVVSSSEKAQLILQKFDHLFSNRSVPDVIRGCDHSSYSVAWLPVSPQWRFLRKVLAVQVFGPKRLEAGQALRHQKVMQLVDFVREISNSRSGVENSSIDIGEAAFVTSLNLLSNSFFSLDFAQYQSDSSQEFRNLIVKVFELVGEPNVADFFPALKFIDPQSVKRRIEVLFKKLLDNFQHIIDERVKSRSLDDHSVVSNNDILDVLLNLRQDDGVKDNDIIHLLLDSFSAGTDTSSSTVEWAMAELMRNPTKMAKVREELEHVIGKENLIVQESDIQRLPYLQAVVKETFRLHPPAPFLLPRRAENDVEIDGYTVPKGSQVFVNAWAMGRDPNTWTNPLSFEPERFLKGREIDYRGRDFELVPFGGGRRICPGLPLAHQMIHLMLASLLHSFEWKLKDGMKPEDINMKERFGLTLLKAEPLLLRAMPINTSSE